MASPLDDVEEYQQEPVAAPPNAALDVAEERLTQQLPYTGNRYARRQVNDQLREIRTERAIQGRKASAEAASNRLRASDLTARGIPTYREANGAVGALGDEAGAPLMHYDKSHNIAYDSGGNPRRISYDSPSGPPNLRDPFENSQVTTDEKTGDQYQKTAGLPWKWVGADEGVKAKRVQEEKDKAVAKEASLLGQKLSIEHADMVAGEKEHSMLTKDLATTVPSLQDPALAGADRETILGAIGKHYDSEYARPEANATNGWFRKDLSPDAMKLRADIDAKKAGALQKANSLFDLKDRQTELGNKITETQQTREDQIDTLIAHGRGHAGPLDTPAGMLERGNIDVDKQPVVHNADGSVSTVRSFSINVGGHEVLLPTVSPDGGDMTKSQAVQRFMSTGQHLGVFDSTDSANAYAQGLHESESTRVAMLKSLTTPEELGTDPVTHVTNAIASGGIPDEASPAILAAAHDAQDANAKAEALKTSNPGLAEQFKALAQGILHGLASGVADIVKGAPGILKQTPLGAAVPKFIEEQYSRAGAAIQSAADTDYDKALADTVGGKIGNFVGGALPFVATSLLPGGAAVSVPATVGTLFSAGYGATREDALKHGADPQTAEVLATASGAVNGVLGLPFKGIGGAIKRVFGGSSPAVIKAAIEAAFQKEGPAGAAKLIDGLRGFVERNEKPVIGNVAQDVRAQVVAAIDHIKGEMVKTPAQRAATVAKEMAKAGALGGGVRVAQNIIGQQYDAERGTFEGVPESALGFAALAGVSHGFDQVVAARRAKQALDLLKPGEEGPPAAPVEPGPTPPPPTSGAEPKQAKGRTVEPTGGEPNAQRPVSEAQPTVKPARPQGAGGEQLGQNVTGGKTSPGALTAGGNEPATAGTAAEIAKPGTVSPTVDEAAHTAATSPTNTKPEPTQAQQQAGNYEKGHIVKLGGAGGIDVAIENPVGSQRSNLDTAKLASIEKLAGGNDHGLLKLALTQAKTGNYESAIRTAESAASALKINAQPDLSDSVHAVATKAYAQPMQSHYGYVKGTVGADKDHIDLFIKPGTPTNYDGPVYVVDQTTTAGKETFDEHKAIVGVNSHEEALAEYRKNYDAEHQNNYGGVTEFASVHEFKKWAESGVKGPAAKSKGVALHPTSDAQRAISAQVMDRMSDRADVLEALEHPVVPKQGKTTNASGIQTDTDGVITIDPAKVHHATDGLTDRQKTKFIDRAIDEEIVHVAQKKWAGLHPDNENLLAKWGGEKDELDAHMAKAYDGWERLNDKQKGFEKQRAILQKRWTGKLSEAAYQALKSFIRYLRTIWEKLTDDQRQSVEDVEAIMKGHEPVAKPVEKPATAKEPFHIQKPSRGNGIESAPKESRGELVGRIDQALAGMREKGVPEDNEHYQTLKAKRTAIAEGKPYSVRDVTAEAISAVGAKIGELTKATGLRSEPPKLSLKERKAKAVDLRAGVESLVGAISTKDQQVLSTLLRPDAPTTLQLDQVARMLARVEQSAPQYPKFLTDYWNASGTKALGTDVGEAGTAFTSYRLKLAELTRQQVVAAINAAVKRGVPEEFILDRSKYTATKLAYQDIIEHKGGSDAVTTGEKPESGKPEHIGVPSGQHVPADKGEIRKKEGGQTSGSGGAGQKAQVEPTGRGGKVSTLEAPNTFEQRRELTEKWVNLSPEETLKKMAQYGIPSGRAQKVWDKARYKEPSDEHDYGEEFYIAVNDDLGEWEKKAPKSNPKAVAVIGVPDDVAKALADLAEGLGAAAPVEPKSSSLKMAAIYHAITAKGHSVEKVARDYAMPVKIVEQIYDKMAGVRLGAAAPTVKITHAALKLKTGEIVAAPDDANNHAGIYAKMGGANDIRVLGAVMGFKTSDGKFLTRDQAFKAAGFRHSTETRLGAAVPHGIIGAIVQKPLPKEKRAVALAAADKLLAAGFDTPEKFATALSTVPALHPYAQSIWDVMAATGDAARGTHDWSKLLSKESKSASVADLHPITAVVQDKMVAGESMPRAELTKLATEHGVETKRADELAEQGVVAAGRIAVTGARAEVSPVDTYDRLVAMYGNQPNLTAKTSTSKVAQAYSTPLPLAYVASRLTDIRGGKNIYEPSAGNGVLLIEANPETQNVLANEIDDNRRASLEAQGFHASGVDATEPMRGEKFDRIIENAPFGTLLQESGENKSWPMWDSETKQIDHAIAARSLDMLADDGRAVLIIAGKNLDDPDARMSAYASGGKFYQELYNRYRVIDHFTVDGDLYKKQGAGWPVDVVVIQGRGRSPIQLPTAKSPRILRSWDELRDELQRSDSDRIALSAYNESEDRETAGGVFADIRTIAGTKSGPGQQVRGQRAEGKPERGGDAGSVTQPVVEQSAAPQLAGGPADEVTRGGPGRSDVLGDNASVEQRGQQLEPDTFRTPYIPSSQKLSFNILVPRNMEAPIRDSLRKLSDEVGGLDDYVRTKLKFKPTDPGWQYLSAEQVDAIAVAIHAVERGSAAVLGDQGGVGKGMVSAAMLVYAHESGRIPVFFTKDAKNYADMIGFLKDLGRDDLVPMFTDNGLSFPDHDQKNWTSGNMKISFQEIARTGKLPRGNHVIFSTYYQIQNDKPSGWKETPGESAARKAKKEPPPDGHRMDAFRRIAPHSIFVLDESHLASGDSSRAWRMGPLLAAAPGAHYASATFAKRPESMGIYSRTTLSRAAPSMESLVEAMTQGGVPLQQAVSAMLADDGLYMRRERDFRHVTFRTHINVESKERDRTIADAYTSGLREILSVSNAIIKATKRLNKLMKREGKAFSLDVAPRLESSNFAAKLHNLVNQYLFAIKAKATADRAIELIKTGRDPSTNDKHKTDVPHRVVIAFQNTMQAAIEGLQHSKRELTFKGMLQAYLDSQRMLKSGQKAFGRGEVEYFYISDTADPEYENLNERQLEQALIRVETNEEGQRIGVVNEGAAKELFRRMMSERFKEVESFIEDLELADMPLSPIDYIRQRLEDEGVVTQEITGRTVGLDRDGKVYTREPHEKSKRAQLQALDQFNNGPVQALLINGSASTGVSAHSSEKFKNKDPRAMLVVQPHLDINEFMQTLWRIDRTGQIFPPYYEVVQTAIPAELRPAAIRARKMASLNANTTSNAESEIKGADVDVFNKYGDEIIYRYLRADSIFVKMLEWPKITDQDGNLKPFEDIRDDLAEAGKLAQGVTGHLAVLPTDEGEDFWEKVTADYVAFISYLNEIGQNDLIADTLDIQAKTVSTKELTAGRQGDSVFDSASVIERVEAQIGKQPREAEEVLEKADEVLRDASETQRKWYADAQEWRDKEEARLSEALVLPERLAGLSNRFKDGIDTIYSSLDLLGQTVRLQNDRGLDAYGAVVDVKLDPDHPLTPSKQIFTIWVNTTKRTLKLAASQLGEDAKRTPREAFVDAYKETEERSNERFIITGNLLAGYVSIKDNGTGAKIVQYTNDKGDLRSGILMPGKFSMQSLVGKSSVEGSSHMRQLLDAGRTVLDTDQIVTIASKKGGMYMIRVKAAKVSGGYLWRDPTLNATMKGGEFVQRGSFMVGEFGPDKLPQVFDRLQALDTPLYFWKAVEGERPVDEALGAAPPRFARDYWTEDVKPTLANMKATMREVVDAAVHVLSPTYGVNKDVVDQVHKLMGERNQVAYTVDRTGEAFEYMFQSMPRPDQITFIDRVKRGEEQPTPELEQAARFIRGVDSDSWQALDAAAKAAGFKDSPVKWLDNHYRVMWKKIPGSVDRGGAPGQGRRPLRGSRGMAKEHTLADMSEGIERGGVPFSYNPITNLKMSLADIWKYTTALKMWSWAKEHGFASFVRGPFPKLPESMVWMDDSIADVWFPAESGEGLIHGGKYAVEEGFGRLINNFLSRDLIRQAKTGRGLMWLKNATTSLELALSAFHAVFETGETVASNIGLGLSKLYNRGLLQKDSSALVSGLMDLIKSPASPVHVATLGAAFRKAAGRPDEFWKTAPGKAFLALHPDARDLINHLFTGGWKPTEVEADWKNQSVRAFVDAISDLKSGTSSNYIGAGLRAFPAANEFLMGPLFDVYIPNLKIGQFVKEMREGMKQNDLKYGAQGYYVDRQGRRYDRPTNTELARKIWRLVEDRFGELNYDTLFWNNTFKSAMQLMFRSVTWKLGSVEAFAGAFGGQGKEFVNAFKERRAPELHRNAAWLFGIFLTTAVLGTIIQTVFARKKITGLTDLVFPRIDPNDDRVRVSIPTYFKDLIHLVHSPTGYVKASLAGWIGRVADLLSNKDYYGVQIRDTDDPATRQALQVGKYATQSILPFSIRGYKNLSSQQENAIRKSMALLGINPAPRYIGQTAAEKQVEHYWQGQRTEEGTKPEQYEIQKGKREIVSQIRHGKPTDIPGALARGTIKPADVPALYKRATMGQLASSIDRMPLVEAEKVFAKAGPDERKQLAGIMSRKRANSLRRSGRTMYTGF